MKGFVKWYDYNKGFGFIVGADSHDYYFRGDGRAISSGDLVTFMPSSDENGRRAREIVQVASNTQVNYLASLQLDSLNGISTKKRKESTIKKLIKWTAIFAAMYVLSALLILWTGLGFSWVAFMSGPILISLPFAVLLTVIVYLSLTTRLSTPEEIALEQRKSQLNFVRQYMDITYLWYKFGSDD